jgi:hypothetical protein
VFLSSDDLTLLSARLAMAGAELRALPAAALAAAWGDTVAAFRDPRSPERRDLDPALARLCRLSPAGLAAGLEAVLGGVRREAAGALFARARPSEEGPILAVLAGNLPGLAVQPLLPALAVRRPILLKSPSAEPLFAPAFVAALARREPRLAPAIAAATWPGGDEAIENGVLARAATVLAYGGGEAIEDLRQRAAGRVIAYGPKTSLAVVGAEVDPAAVADGLARDVALFDQRGCLSIAAVYVAGGDDGRARALGEALAAALARYAVRWPPGPEAPPVYAAVQQLRATAEMRGLLLPLPISAGTVVLEPEPALQPTPGLRTVRLHPLADLARLPGVLAAWSGRLQGAALAGDDALRLAPGLTELGFSRFAAPGELQSPDASWHNGGIDPLAALGG